MYRLSIALSFLVAVIAGAMRARPGVGDPPSRRLQVIAAALAVASICGVIAIDLFATM